MSVGGCYHQLLSRGEEHPDGYVLSHHLSNHLPSEPVVIFDYKRKMDEFNKALYETNAYAATVLEASAKQYSRILVGFPLCPYEAELTVYFCCDRTVFSMRVGKVLTRDKKKI